MKVKIYLEGNEIPEQADELLQKALNHGKEHIEDFPDPAARDLAVTFERSYDEMYQEMLREIFSYLDEIY